MSEIPENLPQESDTRQQPQASRTRWESWIWPRWLPTRARLPLIAQMLGAAALLAAIAMPQWVEPEPPRASAAPAVPAPEPPPEPVRPAHLNLDLRHSFASVDLSVSVDGARALDTKVAGGTKRFGVVGKRSGRSFTKTLDLQPGTRVVRVRVRSNDDKFDQTRVERFDLGSASVASLRVTADKNGLSLIADHPQASPPQEARAVEAQGPSPAAAAGPPIRPASNTAATAVPAASAPSGAFAELYRTLRQVLMALAGFIASVASGFFVEEYLKARVGALSRRSLRG